MKFNLRTSILARFVTVIAATLLLAAAGRMLKAFNPQPDPPGVWGMLGITPFDTIRLNVVNMQFPGFPPDPCNVTMKFLDGNGKVLKQQTAKINTTQAAFLDYTAVGATNFRMEVHPVVIVPSNEAVGCSPVGSAEVFNTNTGETTVFAHPIYIPLGAAPAAQPRSNQ